MRRTLHVGLSVGLASAFACVGEDPELVSPSSADAGASNDAENGGDAPASSSGGQDAGPGLDANAPCNPEAKFGADPALIAGLTASDHSERHVTLNEDETEAFYARFLASSGEVQADIVGSRRSTLNDGWEAPSTSLLSKVNQPGNMDSYPTLAADRLTLFFIQRQENGDHAVKRATRPTAAAPFDDLADLEIEPAIEAYRFPVDLFVTNMGALYLAARPADSASILRIYRAAKKVNGAGYTGIVLQTLGAPTATTSLRAPVLTFDESTMYFAQREQDDGGAATTKVWSATRTPDGWSAPSLVDNINIGQHQYPMWISHDGCRLYVSRLTGAQEDMFVYSRGR